MPALPSLCNLFLCLLPACPPHSFFTISLVTGREDRDKDWMQKEEALAEERRDLDRTDFLRGLGGHCGRGLEERTQTPLPLPPLPAWHACHSMLCGGGVCECGRLFNMAVCGVCVCAMPLFFSPLPTFLHHLLPLYYV